MSSVNAVYLEILDVNVATWRTLSTSFKFDLTFRFFSWDLSVHSWFLPQSRENMEFNLLRVRIENKNSTDLRYNPHLQ
jgi:hypothetical protein